MLPHHTGSQLRRVRLDSGLGLRTVADQLKVSPQAIHQLEKSEAAGTISLKQLENVARVMGHRLVYTLEPEGPLTSRQAQPREVPSTAPQPEPEAETIEPAKFLDNWMDGRID